MAEHLDHQLVLPHVVPQLVDDNILGIYPRGVLLLGPCVPGLSECPGSRGQTRGLQLEQRLKVSYPAHLHMLTALRFCSCAMLQVSEFYRDSCSMAQLQDLQAASILK